MLKGEGPGLLLPSQFPTACEYAGGGAELCPSFSGTQDVDGGAMGAIASGRLGMVCGG